MDPKIFESFVERISKVDTVEGVHAVCADYCRHSGFDNFIYGARVPTSFVEPYIFIISGYPDEWRERYKEQGYLAVDPTVNHCCTETTPIVWEDLAPLTESDPRVRQFMQEAADFRLASGVSFPVHTARGEFAMLSLSSSEQASQSRERIKRSLPYAQLFSCFVHERVRQIIDVREIHPDNHGLTERERECLLWSAEGKTSWETSQILGVSERTVIFHLQNAMKKLNVTNRQQAIARVISMGIISPQHI